MDAFLREYDKECWATTKEFAQDLGVTLPEFETVQETEDIPLDIDCLLGSVESNDRGLCWITGGDVTDSETTLECAQLTVYGDGACNQYNETITEEMEKYPSYIYWPTPHENGVIDITLEWKYCCSNGQYEAYLTPYVRTIRHLVDGVEAKTNYSEHGRPIRTLFERGARPDGIYDIDWVYGWAFVCGEGGRHDKTMVCDHPHYQELRELTFHHD